MPKRLRTPIGNLEPRFDRVGICTNVPPHQLKRALPIGHLEAAAHSFKIEKRRGKRGARILVTCLPDMRELEILKHHEHVLGNYRVTYVELALDLRANSLPTAREKRDWLVQRLDKVRPARGWLRWVPERRDGRILSDNELKKRGLVREPTVEYENRKVEHGQVVYIRRQKLAAKEFGDLIVRTEFKSKGSRAVRQRYGGHSIGDLLATDFEQQAAKYFVLKELDREKLAQTIFPQAVPNMRKTKPAAERHGPITEHEANRLRRAADLAITILERRHWYGDGETLPETIWRNSPTQIKARLRNSTENTEIVDRSKKLLERRYAPRRRKRLTEQAIEACFTPIKLKRLRVRLD